MSESGSSSQSTSDGETRRSTTRAGTPRGSTRRATRSAAAPTRTAGRGEPKDSPGTEGESMMPESPTEDDDRA